jgi:hypothetical protein
MSGTLIAYRFWYKTVNAKHFHGKEMNGKAIKCIACKITIVRVEEFGVFAN